MVVASSTRRQGPVSLIADFLFPTLLKQDFRAKAGRAVPGCHFVGSLLWESCTNFRNVRVKD